MKKTDNMCRKVCYCFRFLMPIHNYVMCIESNLIFKLLRKLISQLNRIMLDTESCSVFFIKNKLKR